MIKALVVLAVASTMSIPATAQTAPNASTTNQAQAAKPQMIKKQVCEDTEDNPYSTIHRRVCRTVQVPAPNNGTNGGEQASAPSTTPNSANR
ncbi:MAG TPA: hypothetical protein VHS33_04840 [Sphingomicrobium sp.]|jgi:hypothetical protein|nr:hypothetical protein [Sphingomicrobium sp.]